MSAEIYAHDGIELQGEDDLITPAEEGFMMGYLDALS